MWPPKKSTRNGECHLKCSVVHSIFRVVDNSFTTVTQNLAYEKDPTWFFQFPNSDNAKSNLTMLFELVPGCKLTSKLRAVTTDNASNLTAPMKIFTESLNSRQRTSLTVNDPHMIFFTHVIKLDFIDCAQLFHRKFKNMKPTVSHSIICETTWIIRKHKEAHLPSLDVKTRCPSKVSLIRKTYEVWLFSTVLQVAGLTFVNRNLMTAHRKPLQLFANFYNLPHQLLTLGLHQAIPPSANLSKHTKTCSTNVHAQMHQVSSYHGTSHCQSNVHETKIILQHYLYWRCWFGFGLRLKVL